MTIITTKKASGTATLKLPGKVHLWSRAPVTVPTRMGSIDKGTVLRLSTQGGRVCSKYKDEFYGLRTSAQESGPREEGFV